MSVSRQPPTEVYSDSLLIWAALVGVICGYVAYRAAIGKSSAGPLRFTLVGLVGGLVGAYLGISMIAGPFVTSGKAFSTTVIGAGLGAAVLCYVLRVIHGVPPQR